MTCRWRFGRVNLGSPLPHRGCRPGGHRTFHGLPAGAKRVCVSAGRLTDVTRKEEYFRAMAKIEKEGVHGDYRCDYQLSQIS